ncbi:MAG: hypothetical protein HFE92_01285 [Acutalibacter muris]|nr:hypothetical protein [Acutalibacter muris]
MSFVFYDVFSMLCKKKGESESKAVEGGDVQLNRSAVVKWKKGSTPEMATIQKLAAHFSVSTDYLIGADLAAQLDVALFKVQDSLRLWSAKLDFAENDEQRAEAEKEIRLLTAEQERLEAEISENKKAPALEGELESIKSHDMRRIARAHKTMPEQDQKRMMTVLENAFPDYFSKDYVDEDTDE